MAMSMDSAMDSNSNGDASSPPPATAQKPPSPNQPGSIGSPPSVSTLPRGSPNSVSSSPPAPPIHTAVNLLNRPLPSILSASGMLGLSLQQLQHPSDLSGHPHLDRSYGNSPPPLPSTDPSANECKLLDYRGQKVAAFMVNGQGMLCLPQAFELFLKHLVGGLHTVYTKLKRLDIVPVVCNVEQVRILRGLGAIQPGVNRCKLLSCRDFDILYKDCTTASSRPGRPPKRASVGLTMPPTALSLKKARLENGEYPGYENGHLARLEKSPLLANGYNHPPTHLNPMQFMPLNHPAAAHTAILSPGGIPISSSHSLSRSDGSIIKGQSLENMDALARSGLWENCRAAYEDIVKHLERLREERGEAERALALDKKARDLSIHNGASNGPSPVLNLSKSGNGGGNHPHDHSGSEAGHTGNEDDEDDDNVSDVEEDEEKDQELSDGAVDIPNSNNTMREVDRHSVSNHHHHQQQQQHHHHQQQQQAAAAAAAALNYSSLIVSDPSLGISSTETLLRNIQGLLKVAADNARQQERQINYEKAELKMEILRERELRENLEKQLIDEQKIRVLYQKRLKKEKKARRRLQDQLEVEGKRRSQYEEALKSTSADTLRMLNETLAQELEIERKNRQHQPQPQLQQPQLQQPQQEVVDIKSSIQDSPPGYYKNSVLFTSAT